MRKASVVAGIGLLIMTMISFVSFPIFQNFIVSGDAVATGNNIMDNQSLFRIILCSFIIIIILDILVAWALYVLLKPVNRSLALLMALFRVVYAAIFASTLNNLFSILHLLNSNSYRTAFTLEQLQEQVLIFIKSFNYGWDIGLAIFGIHILVLGFLIYKSHFIPKFLGIMIVIASFGYLLDSFGKFLLPNYNLAIGMFTFIGEVLFALWLSWKGFGGLSNP